MNKTFYISDTHVGHENIVHKLGLGRPFRNLTHMSKTIRDNWYATVTEEDDVYLLGDIAMGNFDENIEFFRDLPGRKFLVPGNHDKVGGTQSQARNERFTSRYEDVGMTVLPDIVSKFVETSYGVQEVLLSHYPYGERYAADGTIRRDKYAKHRPVNEGLPLIHGHTHHIEILQEEYPLQYHIGVDANNYTPVDELVIIEWLEGLKLQGLI